MKGYAMSNFKRFVWERRVSWQGKTLDYLEQLREWQWLPGDRLHELQQQRLLAMLQHAYEHTSYYRKLFQQYAVVDGRGQVRLERFSEIPFLEKDAVREHFQELLSDDLASRNWYEGTTGGSTGVPVRFIRDREYFCWTQAIKALDDEWTGRSLIDKQVRLWGSERDIMDGHEKIRTHIGRWLRNERWYSSFRMRPDDMVRYVKEINEFRPVQILAYAESLYELARFCEREGLSVYTPQAIMTSAGTLYDHMRQTIERVFQAPVFNRYGSTEAGDMACECERHQGLHVSTATHLIEIVDQEGKLAKPGETGEIVVTLLHNYAMPYIRYRIGDMGAWSTQPCSCGRGLPLLKEVSGRVTDMFVDMEGRWVDGRVFLYILDPKPYIRKFQVIQERADFLRILIVPVKDIGAPEVVYAQEVADIKQEIKKVMACEVQVEFLDEILPTSSGKYRYTISHVPR